MTTSEKYHEKKYSVMQKVNSLWFAYGLLNNKRPLDFKVEVYLSVIYVGVLDFDKGVLLKKSSFNVNLQAGGVDTAVSMVEKQMINALRECGAEFATLKEFKES